MGANKTEKAIGRASQASSGVQRIDESFENQVNICASRSHVVIAHLMKIKRRSVKISEFSDYLNTLRKGIKNPSKESIQTNALLNLARHKKI